MFALRRRGRREEGMHIERQERGMETDAERQRDRGRSRERMTRGLRGWHRKNDKYMRK